MSEQEFVVVKQCNGCLRLTSINKQLYVLCSQFKESRVIIEEYLQYQKTWNPSRCICDGIYEGLNEDQMRFLERFDKIEKNYLKELIVTMRELPEIDKEVINSALIYKAQKECQQNKTENKRTLYWDKGEECVVSYKPNPLFFGFPNDQ